MIDGGIAILEYADDTVLCIEEEHEKAINLKLLLYVFEMMLGLKINFLKSENLSVGGDARSLRFYADLFYYQICHFPMKYLGVPVNFLHLEGG